MTLSRRPRLLSDDKPRILSPEQGAASAEGAGHLLRLRNFALIAGVAALLIYAMVVGRALLLPLVVAIVVWYLINVLASAYHHAFARRLPGWLCMPLAVVTFLALTWIIADMIGGNLAQVADVLPAYETKLNMLIAQVYGGLDLGQAPTLNELIGNLDIRALAATTATALADIASSAALVFIYVLFLLLEQGGFNRKLSALFTDDTREAEVRRILHRIGTDIQTYLRIKVMLSLLIGIYGYVVLWALGVDFAPFWSALLFLFNFIPTVGWPMALVGPVLFALLQFDSITPFVIVAFGIGIVQLVVNNFVEPAMMGRSLNVSPFVIILALVVFGTLWGLVGMVLCVPILVIVMIILANFPRTRGFAVLLSANGEITEER